MEKSYDAIIIGAGIIGAATGLELARRGWRTLNVDRLPAAGYGSTSNSCAIIRTHYSTTEGTALAWEGYHYWKHWSGYLGAADERGLAVFHETGCLVMKTEHNGHLRTVCANLEALGIPFEHWDREAITGRLPLFSLARHGPPRALADPDFGEPTGGEVEGAVFFPNAGYISDPQLATHNLQRAAEAAGATFAFNTRVTGIPRANGRVRGIELEDGTSVEAPVVVNVAGPHSAIINEMAGVTGDMRVGTRALRQEVVHVPAPAGVDYDRIGMVTSDSDIGCYTRPEVGGNILVGSEDPECDSREWVDPDDFERGFTGQATVQALRFAQRVPSLGIPNRLSGVVDLYDVADDWIPIYDRSALDGFYMAIGTSGNQFKNAPVAGLLIAELITACQAGHDHDADPLVVTLPRTGHRASIGFYSRLREVNTQSSFSVLG